MTSLNTPIPAALAPLPATTPTLREYLTAHPIAGHTTHDLCADQKIGRRWRRFVRTLGPNVMSRGPGGGFIFPAAQFGPFVNAITALVNDPGYVSNPNTAVRARDVNLALNAQLAATNAAVDNANAQLVVAQTSAANSANQVALLTAQLALERANVAALNARVAVMQDTITKQDDDIDDLEVDLEDALSDKEDFERQINVYVSGSPISR